MINGIGNRSANSTDFALGSNIKSDHQNALSHKIGAKGKDAANADTCFISGKARQLFKEQAASSKSMPATALEALLSADQAIPENLEPNILISAYNDGLVSVNVQLTGGSKPATITIEQLFNYMEPGGSMGVSLAFVMDTAGMDKRLFDLASKKENVLNDVFEKLLTKYVEAASGGTVTLGDLYAENGRIMGMSEKLSEYLNSEEIYCDKTEAMIGGAKNALLKFLKERDA